MNGATVGLAAALGLQLSNLFWDVFFVVLCLVGVCFLCALAFGGLVIWDMLRARKPVTLPMLPVGTARGDTLPPAGDELSEDELSWLACEWCHDPTCIDSTPCSCRVSCGRMLCKAESACPCCAGEPYRVNDCTCRDDCGVLRCQAADPEARNA